MTWPTLSLSPSLTRISLHDAADRRRNFDDGLVRFQLHHGLAFFDVGAGRDHQANQIALLNVFAQLGQFEFRHCPKPFLADGRVRLFGIDAQILHGLLDGFDLDLIFASQRVQSREHDVLGVDFKEVAQGGAILAATEAVGAQRNQPARHPARNALRQNLHVVGCRYERARAHLSKSA